MSDTAKRPFSLNAEAFAQALRLQSQNPDFQGKGLRLYIEGKGCDGFFYGVAFDQAGAEDLVSDQDGLQLVIDQDSYKFCRDSVVTWFDDGKQQGFIVENPNHTKYRGKFFRRRSWQEALAQKNPTGENHLG